MQAAEAAQPHPASGPGVLQKTTTWCRFPLGGGTLATGCSGEGSGPGASGATTHESAGNNRQQQDRTSDVSFVPPERARPRWPLIPRSASAGRCWPAPCPGTVSGASPPRAAMPLVFRSSGSRPPMGRRSAPGGAAAGVGGGSSSGSRCEPLHDLVRLVAGGVPQIWELP